MDLALELTFVLATKTLLSADCGVARPPLRIDRVFEKYMRLAGILLGLPELDFQLSSRSLRQFAKALEQQGYLELNTAEEAALAGEIPGMVVMKFFHNNIDDVYPDSTIFDVGDADEVAEGWLGADWAVVGESVECDACELLECGRICGISLRRKQQRELMLHLHTISGREEERLEQLQERFDKTVRRAVEKEFRKLNIRCNVEAVRGQPKKGFDSKGKYQTLTHTDTDTLKFYACHSSKGSGQTIASKLQFLENKLKKDTKFLGDKSRHLQSIMDKDSGRSLREGVSSICQAARAAQTSLDFAKPGEEFERSTDRRGRLKHETAAEPRTFYVGGVTAAVGANLKLSSQYRWFLGLLGFESCTDLATLPMFADLRSSYKKASLVLHPDKLRDPAVGEGGSTCCKLTEMTFQDFQIHFEELQSTFYDAGQQDFSAAVKMHLPKVRKRTSKVGRNG